MKTIYIILYVTFLIALSISVSAVRDNIIADYTQFDANNPQYVGYNVSINNTCYLRNISLDSQTDLGTCSVFYGNKSESNILISTVNAITDKCDFTNENVMLNKSDAYLIVTYGGGEDHMYESSSYPYLRENLNFNKRVWSTNQGASWYTGTTGYSIDDILYIETDTFTTDTTPPIIFKLNCTSCNIPNGDDESPYETEDTTPTFKFDTDENAWCAIDRDDKNYTAMGASKNCTSGEGTMSHICTLTTQDKFTNAGTNYLYISCKDSSGNEGNVISDHSKSNSGPIWMEIQGASETSGDTAIELGITTSEIGGTATIYSSQQISARNLANNQFSGIFDKMAVNGNKRWTFNYVSAGESSITGLFNLTPVLYVLQLQNQTNATIIDQVGKLINSTWP